jgi:hypothetical protein
VAKREEKVADEEKRDALVVEGVTHVLEGVDKVAVVLPPLEFQLLAEHLQRLRGVLILVDVLNGLTSTRAAVAT